MGEGIIVALYVSIVSLSDTLLCSNEVHLTHRYTSVGVGYLRELFLIHRRTRYCPNLYKINVSMAMKFQ